MALSRRVPGSERHWYAMMKSGLARWYDVVQVEIVAGSGKGQSSGEWVG